MALFPISGDVAQFNLGAPASSDQFSNGIRLKADNTAAYSTLSAGQQSQNGFLLDANGAIVCVDATAGLPASVTWRNGLPFDSTGALCVSSGAIFSYSNGIPLAANGAVSAAGVGYPLLIDTFPILVDSNQIIFS